MGSKESETIFIPVETTSEHALELMITEMNQIRMKYISESYTKYEPFFQQNSKLQDEKIIKQVRRKLLEWIDAIPVYGFNSSGYDINVFRKFLPKVLSKFQKLYEMYRNNLVGGPSIVFHHYHEKIIRNQKVCKKVVDFDANALYLWAIGQDMLCGDHEIVDAYPGLVNDILSGLFYGVVECNVQVPEQLNDYFAEMPPIFKHSDISYENVSEDTKAQVKEKSKTDWKLTWSENGLSYRITQMVFTKGHCCFQHHPGCQISNATILL
jgi:hypothetical protein